ncbi:hypothetical protein ACFW5V_28660 [Streptomyces sp. NPDC058762]|uniref:hypothetical protein n=1 Tax=Streptomyces sp. NPDC058762 TaxID=3346629 RepID=UPI003684374C
MSALPERYQRYAHPGPRPVHGEVELQAERDPIVWVPDAYGEMVPMLRSHAPVLPDATPPRDLAPQPVFDPLAQRLVGAGVGAGAAGAGLGWGIGQAAAGVATIGGSTAVVAMLALWLLARASRPSVHVRQEVHNHARWFGKNTTNLG